MFGDYGGTDVFIVDKAKASILDSFLSFDPVMSPDQRWIVYQKTFPLHGVEATEEYLIYDLTKSPAQNRPDGDTTNHEDVGTTIYPPGMKNLP